MSIKIGHSASPIEEVLLGVPVRDVPKLIPGTVLALIVSVVADWLAQVIGTQLMGFTRSPISGIMVAILLGLVARNTIGVPAHFRPGINFCVKKLLRLGIILLGVRLSLVDVLKISLSALPVVAIVLGLTLFLAWELARRMGLSERLGILTAVGTSICGASAIVATAPCIEASDEEVSYSVANITLFGLLAMFLYPFVAHFLFGSAPLKAGLFLGTSIHETAQVTGAGLMYDAQYPTISPTGGEVAVIAKLVRNALMTVVIPLVSLLYAQRNCTDSRRRGSFMQYFPTFVFGFIALSLLRTGGDAMLNAGGIAYGLWSKAAWAQSIAILGDGARILLTAAMAGVGLGTSYEVLKGLGVRPLILGLGASALVGVIASIAITAVTPILG